MRKVLVLLICLVSLSAQAQRKVWVFLKDKPQATEQLKNPENFLSSRAIERRVKQNISLDITDVPLEEEYVSVINDLGYNIIGVSKWLNALAVEVNGNSELVQLKTLPFVTEIQAIQTLVKTELITMERKITGGPYYNYGNSFAQISQMKGHYLHQSGYTGQNMMIAVIDGGFSGVDLFSAFDSLWTNNRVIATYDFVDGDTNVFHSGSHGTKVLSTMAAFWPGNLVGTAPRANYVLLKSEDESQEVKQEEHNWVMAAEFADSIGADLINSSLGYNTFDGGVGDYTHADMDGRTTVIAQGAIFAQRKGILVCNSMGNEGSISWRKLLSPADVDSILSIGGVNHQGSYSSFSGQGPTADGRLKPNVTAQAEAVVVIGSNGTPTLGSGTSFSTPLVCGLAACLWQANPNSNYYQILKAIERSSHKYFSPDTLVGYGIPDFSKAFWILGMDEEIEYSGYKVFPVPFYNHISVKGQGLGNRKKWTAQIFNAQGKLVLQQEVTSSNYTIQLKILRDLPKGVYVLHLTAENKVQSFKIIR